jgi:flagellar biogenesis protein FliO
MASIKMAGSLVLISGIIIGLFYMLKRIRWYLPPNDKKIQMHLLSMLHLAPKRAVALVQIRDQWLVLGVGTESVTFITKLDPPESPGEVEIMTTEQKKNFHSILQGLSFWPKTSVMRRDENT